MGKIIAISNQKGGVGKTTTAINLSASLAAGEYQTLVVDLDPQANCTSGLGLEPRRVSESTYDVLVGEKTVEGAIVSGPIPRMSLVPSGINLVAAEIEIIGLNHREQILARALAPVHDRYDFIIIDCPPSLGLLTVNALTAAHSVLIPVQAEYFALEGLGQLLNTIRIVRRKLNRSLAIEGVLLTLFDTRLRLSNQVAAELKRYFGSRVFSTVVQRNVKIAEAPSFGKPVLLHDANCIGARNYLSLASEIVANNQKFLKPRAPVPNMSMDASTNNVRLSFSKPTQSRNSSA